MKVLDPLHRDPTCILHRVSLQVPLTSNLQMGQSGSRPSPHSVSCREEDAAPLLPACCAALPAAVASAGCSALRCLLQAASSCEQSRRTLNLTIGDGAAVRGCVELADAGALSRQTPANRGGPEAAGEGSTTDLPTLDAS